MTSTHFKAKREIYISSLIISRLHSINLSYTEDFAECSFHHCLVSSTSPAAFRSRPCTELDNLEIKGATSHSGPFTTTDFWLLWAVASGVVSCRCTKTLMALVATASSRGPVSYDKNQLNWITFPRPNNTWKKRWIVGYLFGNLFDHKL